MSENTIKTLTARIPLDLHTELKAKLARERMTYQDWQEKVAREYVKGNLQV